jgi:hypothetical protein
VWLSNGLYFNFLNVLCQLQEKSWIATRLDQGEPLHKALLAEVPHPLIWSKFGNTQAQLTSGKSVK